MLKKIALASALAFGGCTSVSKSNLNKGVVPVPNKISSQTASYLTKDTLDMSSYQCEKNSLVEEFSTLVERVINSVDTNLAGYDLGEGHLYVRFNDGMMMSFTPSLMSYGLEVSVYNQGEASVSYTLAPSHVSKFSFDTTFSLDASHSCGLLEKIVSKFPSLKPRPSFVDKSVESCVSTSFDDVIEEVSVVLKNLRDIKLINQSLDNTDESVFKGQLQFNDIIEDVFVVEDGFKVCDSDVGICNKYVFSKLANQSLLTEQSLTYCDSEEYALNESCSDSVDSSKTVFRIDFDSNVISLLDQPSIQSNMNCKVHVNELKKAFNAFGVVNSK